MTISRISSDLKFRLCLAEVMFINGKKSLRLMGHACYGTRGLCLGNGCRYR